eukprot:5686959-Karenia_brevis.AAC.1
MLALRPLRELGLCCPRLANGDAHACPVIANCNGALLISSAALHPLAAKGLVAMPGTQQAIGLSSLWIG